MDKSNEPRHETGGHTESLDSPFIVIDEPGDTTRRPRRPNIPLDPPPPRRPEPDPRDVPPSAG